MSYKGLWQPLVLAIFLSPMLASAQSEEDTVAWLNTKLPVLCNRMWSDAISLNTAPIADANIYSVVGLGGKSAVITSFMEAPVSKMSSIELDTIEEGRLEDHGKITLSFESSILQYFQDEAGSRGLCESLFGNRSCLSNPNVQGDGGGIPIGYTATRASTRDMTLFCKDRASAERVSKALRHLAELKGAPIHKSDLF